MDKFDTLRVFVAVAAAGSFVGASRQLGLSAPAVTRAIARLEADLGVPLLHRTTRVVRLSEAGQRYFFDAQRILERLDEADAALAGSYREPAGALTLTAPVLFGQRYVVPVIAEFMARFPAITVRAQFLDRVTNLLEDGIDIAVRLGHLNDSTLYARQIGTIHKVTCAAPAYFEIHPRPVMPDDLRAHAIVHSTAVEPSTVWDYGDQHVRVTPRLQCNQNGAVVGAAEAGVGITRLLSYQVADALAAGRLERVLEAHEPEPIPINLVYLEGRMASARIHAFLDLAAQRLPLDLGV